MNSQNIPITRLPGTKFVPKGHDRYLHDLQGSGQLCTVRRMGGEMHRGTVVKRDKFTITLRHADTNIDPATGLGHMVGSEEVIFKHDIAGIIILPTRG